MIVENTATEIGDEILIKGNVPIVGLISLNSYTDSTVGESVDKYFTKYFRYSIDGVNYSEYIELTNLNVSEVEVNPKDTFYIEYRYIREGLDSSGILQLDSITINGSYIDSVCGEVFSKSIFAEYLSCPDEEVLGWCINVLDKLYNDIVPKYITRKENQSTTEDRDYIDFWRTISCYFAVIVVYGRKMLERFFLYNKTFQLFLKQRGFFIRSNEETEDMLVLRESYYNEIRKRGTLKIIRKKGTEPIDGELLRLIEFRENDEFIFNLNENKNIGWNIGNGSPCYKGLGHIHNVIKGYEETQDFVDLTKYPLQEDSFISIITDGSKDVLSIENVSTGLESGIVTDSSFLIPVVDTLDYEITFYLKQPELKSNITFGVKGYDENGLPLEFRSIFSDTITNRFFTSQKLSRNDKYIFVRGILYNKYKTNLSAGDSFLNIGVGSNLKSPTGLTFICPELYITGDGSTNSLYIWDFKVRPLRTSYSKGFIQTNNYIECWLKNRNQNYSLDEIQTNIERYLIPYNTNIKIIDLDTNTSQDSSVSISSSESTSQSTSLSTSISSSGSSSSGGAETGDLYGLYYQNCCKLSQVNNLLR